MQKKTDFHVDEKTTNYKKVVVIALFGGFLFIIVGLIIMQAISLRQENALLRQANHEIATENKRLIEHKKDLKEEVESLQKNVGHTPYTGVPFDGDPAEQEFDVSEGLHAVWYNGVLSVYYDGELQETYEFQIAVGDIGVIRFSNGYTKILTLPEGSSTYYKL